MQRLKLACYGIGLAMTCVSFAMAISLFIRLRNVETVLHQATILRQETAINSKTLLAELILTKNGVLTMKPTLALLAAGNPYHMPRQMPSEIANAYFRARPLAHPSRRAESFRYLVHNVSEFTKPSLFVYDPEDPLRWKPFISRSLISAVVAGECNSNHSRGALAQWENMYCSLVLMRAYEATAKASHEYIARIRMDFPINFQREWFTSNERLVVGMSGGLQGPYARQTDADCEQPTFTDPSVMPNDQFLLGHAKVMSDILTSMLACPKKDERCLFFFMTSRTINAEHTFAKVPGLSMVPESWWPKIWKDSFATNFNASMEDMRCLINATGIYYRENQALRQLAHDGIVSSGVMLPTWKQTCKFRGWSRRADVFDRSIIAHPDSNPYLTLATRSPRPLKELQCLSHK